MGEIYAINMSIKAEFLLDITKNFKNVIIGKEKFNHIDHLEINQHSFWVITLTK